MVECNMHWIIVGVKPAYYLKLFLKWVVSRDLILKKFEHGTSSVTCQEQESL